MTTPTAPPAAPDDPNPNRALPAVPGASLPATVPTIPTLVPPAFEMSQEEWAGMDDYEKRTLMAAFQDELARTTEGTKVDFPEFKYPQSGSKFWIVGKDDNGDDIPAGEIQGTIIFAQPVRSWWENKDITNSPPDCKSMDTKVPVPGMPKVQSKTCASCPRSQWGTGKDGRGQDCTERLNVFFLYQVDDTVPTLVSLPPTQLKPYGAYAVALRQKGLPISAIRTRMKLVGAKSKGGIAYTGVHFMQGDKLGIREMQRSMSIRDAFHEHMLSRGVRLDEAQEAEDLGPQPGDDAVETISREAEAERREPPRGGPVPF